MDNLEPTTVSALPDRNLIALLRRLLRPDRRTVVALLLVGLAASLFEGVGLGLFIPFLESIQASRGGEPGGGRLGEAFGRLLAPIPDDQRLTVIATLIFGCVLLKAGLNFAQALLSTKLTARVGHRLRSRIFDEVLTIDFRELNRIGASKYLNALHTESWRVTQAVATLLSAVVTLGSFVVYVALLLALAPKLTVVVIALMALITLLVRFMMRGVGRMGSEMTRANAVIARQMVDGVDGVEVIRAFGRERHERDRFNRASQQLNRLLIRVGRLASAVYPIYEVLVAAILVGVLFTQFEGPVDIAQLLVFVFLLYRIEPKVKELDRARVDLISLEASVRETLDLIHWDAPPTPSSGGQPFARVRDSIRFENVSFRYADGGPALENVSVRIPARRMVALVGRSGAGKSTLVRLLLRFHDPSQGAVEVDGVPLPEIDLSAWRARIAVVSQKVYLFTATVFENIEYGRLGATSEEVVNAAKEAGAHDFIERLPQGYQTLLGEGGARLSGGEEQRLALARAIVRDPEILILDEATNALDSISERLVQQALERLRQRCTMVVIAHRLSTIASADRIVVLEHGRVVEQGARDELLQRDGRFAELYRMQAAQVARASSDAES
jgi:subfamily B ATP-binding cassette protein MsbA